MSVAAPPQQPKDDLEALIEEARQRTRRRRRGYAALLILAVVAGAITYLLVLRPGNRVGAGSGGAVGTGPRSARIRHVVVVQQTPASGTAVDLATGRTSRLAQTEEIWFDPVTHLFRTVFRLDGRVFYDAAGVACISAANGTANATADGKRVCISPYPFPDAGRYRIGLERGTLTRDGEEVVGARRVIWVRTRDMAGDQGLAPAFERAAVDARTHQLVALEEYLRGKLARRWGFRFLPTVPRGSVRFPVPGGRPPPGLQQPPFVPVHGELAAGRRAASAALGRRPLWLGKRFAGYRFRSIAGGTKRVPGIASARGRLARLVYRRPSDGAVLRIDELRPRDAAAIGPSLGLAVPPPGRLFVSGFPVLRKDGVVVAFAYHRGLEDRALLAAVRVLRPLPRRGPAGPPAHAPRARR